MTFFPEIQVNGASNGAIIVYQSNGTTPQGMIFGIDPTNPASMQVYVSGAALNGTPDTQVVARYSPQHQCVVFGGGGGNNKFWRLSSAGSVTALADFPGTPPISCGNPTTLLVDNPANGNFIAISGPTTWWDFDPTGSGTWTAKSGTAQVFVTNTPDGPGSPFGTV